jgi:hypothetical protein
MDHHPITEFRCLGMRTMQDGYRKPCSRRLLDHALALGSVVEIKCDICNAKYVLAMTTNGLLVAERRFVSYTPIPEAVTGNT